MTNVKRIESYGLYDFCKDVQEALKDGYVFDFETSENFPTAFGTMLTCGLVKPISEKVKTESQDVQQPEIVQNDEQVDVDVEPTKRGPKSKK